MSTILAIAFLIWLLYTAMRWIIYVLSGQKELDIRLWKVTK